MTKSLETDLKTLESREYVCKHREPTHHRPLLADNNTPVAAVYLEREKWPGQIFLSVSPRLVLVVGSQTDLSVDDFIAMLDGGSSEALRPKPLSGQKSLFDWPTNNITTSDD